MNRRRIAFVVLPVVLGWVVSGAILPAGPPGTISGEAILAASSSTYEHAPRPSVSTWAVADTVEAGRVFIAQLPDSLSGRAIQAYSADRLPLKSWLLDRSFFWATTSDDLGVHVITMQGHPLLPVDSTNTQDSGEPIDWSLTVVVQ